MPPRSVIDRLSQEDRVQVNQLLIDRGFSGYGQLAEDLADLGFEISRSTLARYGKDFQQRCELLRAVTGQAEAIVQATGDDQNAINEALIKLCQQKVFTLLMDMESSEGISEDSISKITRAVADLGRASVQQKKYRQEVKAKVEAKFNEIDNSRRQLDPETLRIVREEIYGLL